MAFKVYVRVARFVKAAAGRCDECGAAITPETAAIVTDDTGTFPVCKACKHHFD